jgi:hypothetical protein
MAAAAGNEHGSDDAPWPRCEINHNTVGQHASATPTRAVEPYTNADITGASHHHSRA